MHGGNNNQQFSKQNPYPPGNYDPAYNANANANANNPYPPPLNNSNNGNNNYNNNYNNNNNNNNYSNNEMNNMGPPQPSGMHSHPPPPSDGRLEPVTGLRDPWFIALFVVHFLGVIALIIINGSKDDEVKTNDDVNSTKNNEPTDVGSVITLLVGTSCVAAAFGMVWMVLMHKVPKGLIWFGLIANVVMLFVGAVYFAAQESYGPAVIFFLFAGLSALYAYLVRRRIPFSAAMLTMSTSVIKQYPANFVVSALGLVCQIAFIIFWSYAVGLSTRKENSTWAFLYLLLSFYWTTQVISGVVHTTVAGCVGSWYYATGHENPTILSLKRATTTSFGSICLGSLIVAAIKFTRRLVQIAMRSTDNFFVQFMCNCFFGILERLVELFNIYGLTYVALFGMPYIQASKATYELIKKKGMEVLINENLTDAVLFFGALIGGVCSAVIAYPWAVNLRDDAKIASDAVAIVVVAAFVLGFVVVAVQLAPVDSAIATIFVGYAEDPAMLRQVNPDFHSTLENTYRSKIAEQPPA